MTKKRINSCAKGKRIEREACKFLTSLGFPAERGARNGVKSGCDIICPELKHLHIECKGDESIGIGTEALYAAMRQSTNDCAGRFPVVLWRKKRGRWMLSWRGMCELVVTREADRDTLVIVDKYDIDSLLFRMDEITQKNGEA